MRVPVLWLTLLPCAGYGGRFRQRIGRSNGVARPLQAMAELLVVSQESEARQESSTDRSCFQIVGRPCFIASSGVSPNFDTSALASAATARNPPLFMTSTTVDTKAAKGDDVEVKMTTRLPTGTLVDADKTVKFKIGSGTVPSLEEAVVGMQVGERSAVDLPPEEAYGAFDQSKVKTLQAAYFAAGVKEGDIVNLPDLGQGRVAAIETYIDGKYVVVNYNHRLAGQEMKCEFEVMQINSNGGDSAASSLPKTGGTIQYCSFEVMNPKSHGTSGRPVQEYLRWNVDNDDADRICNFNRHGAEKPGYFADSSTFMSEVSWDKKTVYYDSVTGKPLFVAPIGRTMGEFISESEIHGWPSFRDEEVVWENVRVLQSSGEAVSVSGTHLGHNLPDASGNRYCINLVSVAGLPSDDGAADGPQRGMEMPGWQGKSVQIQGALPDRPASKVFLNPSWPPAWPYQASDFERWDESGDDKFYNQPRMVTHIDEDAIGAIRDFYASQFALAPQGEYSVLDICSSWISNYPKDIRAKRVAITGMVEEELAANKQATEYKAKDLNVDPTLPFGDNEFDFVTNVVSVDYLVKPRGVFEEMHRVLKPGGVAIMSFSNRCFASKAIAMWVADMDDGPGHCQIVGNYFRFNPNNGWRDISSADISPNPGGSNPMWVVTAVKA